MKFSVGAFLAEAFSTRSVIFDTVDSPKLFVIFSVSKPLWLMQPDRASSPLRMLLGTDSPVSALVSSMDSPSTTMPSSGIFSPGFTTMISPTATLSGETTCNTPFRLTVAESGQMSIRSEMDFLERFTASDWKNSPT